MPCTSLGRRLMAIMYDWLLMIGLVLIMYALLYAALSGQWFEQSPWALWLKRAYVWLVAAGYFVYCWAKGCTVGMRSWKLRIVLADGSPPTLYQLIVRYVVATVSTLFLGFGFWTALLSRDNLTWHDALSGTRLVKLDA